MGNIKKRNRNLPHHPEHHYEEEGMLFFEQIIKDEIKKAIESENNHSHVHFSPGTTSYLNNHPRR